MKANEVRNKDISQNEYIFKSYKRVAYLLFFPIILFGLVSRALDNIMDCSNFQIPKKFFKIFYDLRLCFFFGIIILWRYLKNYTSPILILYLFYAYNFVFSALEICNVFQFIEDYNEYSDYGYYQTFFLKIIINFIFFICWVAMIFFNLVKE